MKPKQQSVKTGQYALPDLKTSEGAPVVTSQQMASIYENSCMQCIHRGEYGRCNSCMRTENNVMKFTKFERATTPTGVV